MKVGLINTSGAQTNSLEFLSPDTEKLKPALDKTIAAFKLVDNYNNVCDLLGDDAEKLKLTKNSNSGVLNCRGEDVPYTTEISLFDFVKNVNGFKVGWEGDESRIFAGIDNRKHLGLSILDAEKGKSLRNIIFKETSDRNSEPSYIDMLKEMIVIVMENPLTIVLNVV